MLHHVAVSTHIWHSVNHPPCVGVSWCTYTSTCACDLPRTTYCVAAAAPSNKSPCSPLIGFRVPPCLKPCSATVSDRGFPLPCAIVIGLDANAPGDSCLATMCACSLLASPARGRWALRKDFVGTRRGLMLITLSFHETLAHSVVRLRT